jgi:hypothetical protein
MDQIQLNTVMFSLADYQQGEVQGYQNQSSI